MTFTTDYYLMFSAEGSNSFDVHIMCEDVRR